MLVITVLICVFVAGPSSLMGSVTEILVRACSVDVGQDNLPAVQAQASASIALSKYMLVCMLRVMLHYRNVRFKLAMQIKINRVFFLLYFN